LDEATLPGLFLLGWSVIVTTYVLAAAVARLGNALVSLTFWPISSH
jgi:hypothetical protein